jgi:O-antigen ligase
VSGSAIVAMLERGLSRLQGAIERGDWRDLFALAAAAALVGIVCGLAGAYSVAFVAVCSVLGVVAYRSSPAACVLVALACPVVALGSVDVGFHMVPAYVFVAAGVLGVLRRGELRGLRPRLPDYLLVGFLAVAVAVTLANVGRVPGATVVDAAGANGRDLRWLAQATALLAMAGLYLLIRAGVRNEAQLAAVLRGILVATVFVGAYAVYQIVGRELDLPYTYVNERRADSALPENSRYIRVNGTLTEASPLAQFAAIALCLGAAWLAAGARRPPWLTRRVAAAVALGAAGLVVLTLSKSAGLACAIWVPLVIATVPRARPRREAVAVGVALVLALAVAAVAFSGPVVRLSGQRGVSGERYVREGYWVAAVGIARDHPFGVGVGNYTFYFPVYASLSTKYEYIHGVTDAHNLFLEAVAETGAIGGALYLGFCLALVLGALHAARRRRDQFLRATVWGVAGAFAIGVTMHLTYSYFYFPFEWVLAGLLAALPALLASSD